MPQGEKFWNPYRLIPAKEVGNRLAPSTHERFDGHSGIISCSIENLTPLFIGTSSKASVRPFQTRQNRHVIPGSSLKGMLRSLTELVGGGCFVVSNDRSSAGIPASPVPLSMKTCNQIKNLCIACRMFGAMERKSESRVHMGKIGVGDAVIVDDDIKSKVFQILLSSCGVRHEPFYRSADTGIMDGKSRKLYFHQPLHRETLPPVESKLQSRAWQVQALLPGHRFQFDVQYNGLTDQELSLLLYVLCLEQSVSVVLDEEKLRLTGPLRHRIGNAKPLGMGTCHIQIDKWLAFPRAQKRFASLSNDQRRVLKKQEELSPEISKWIDPYVKDTSATMTAFRKMMIWDETDTRIFKYPMYSWFKNPINISTTLKPI